MPDTLALLVGSIAGVAALLLSRVWPRGRDGLHVGLVIAFVLMWGVDLAPLPLGDTAPWWLTSVCAAGAVLVGLVLMANAQHFERTHLLGAVLLSCVGVYLAVPDTEPITVLMVMLGILIVGSGLTPVVTGDGPVVALGVLYMWAAGVGASGRPAAVVAAFGSLGVLWVLPTWRTMGRRPRGLTPAQLWGLAVVHAVVAVLCARLGGLGDSFGSAVVVVLPIVVIGGVAAVLVDGYLSNRRPKRAHWKRARPRRRP